MSALEFLIEGGMAQTGGDMPEVEQKRAQEIIKKFGEGVRAGARTLMLPASANVVFRATYLLVAKDRLSLHYVFAEKPGGNVVTYRDFSTHGQVPTPALVQQVRNEIGDVAWAFNTPVSLLSADADSSGHVTAAVEQYLKYVLQRSQSSANNAQSHDEAVGVAELAPFIAKFREDHPRGTKTAFVMMSFANTDAHKVVVEAVRDILAEHGIRALRADSKEYADDLFTNIRTYMHCCDFGVAIFERILQDDFNPNVSLETGYMLGLGRPVCLLKDGTLKSLPSDLVGKLYKQYNPQKVRETVGPELVKWMKDRSLA